MIILLILNYYTILYILHIILYYKITESKNFNLYLIIHYNVISINIYIRYNVINIVLYYNGHRNL